MSGAGGHVATRRAVVLLAAVAWSCIDFKNDSALRSQRLAQCQRLQVVCDGDGYPREATDSGVGDGGCGPGQCDGCCVDGICATGRATNFCGTDGAQCTDCRAAQAVCVPFRSGGTCSRDCFTDGHNVQSIAECSRCCSGQCSTAGGLRCSSSGGAGGAGGGSAGGSAVNGGPGGGSTCSTSCQGCCDLGSCFPGTSVQQCGRNGQQCTNCMNIGMACTNNECSVAGPGGGSAGGGSAGVQAFRFPAGSDAGLRVLEAYPLNFQLNRDNVPLELANGDVVLLAGEAADRLELVHFTGAGFIVTETRLDAGSTTLARARMAGTPGEVAVALWDADPMTGQISLFRGVPLSDGGLAIRSTVSPTLGPTRNAALNWSFNAAHPAALVGTETEALSLNPGSFDALASCSLRPRSVVTWPSRQSFLAFGTGSCSSRSGELGVSVGAGVARESTVLVTPIASAAGINLADGLGYVGTTTPSASLYIPLVTGDLQIDAGLSLPIRRQQLTSSSTGLTNTAGSAAVYNFTEIIYYGGAGRFLLSSSGGQRFRVADWEPVGSPGGAVVVMEGELDSSGLVPRPVSQLHLDLLHEAAAVGLAGPMPGGSRCGAGVSVCGWLAARCKPTSPLCQVDGGVATSVLVLFGR